MSDIGDRSKMCARTRIDNALGFLLAQTTNKSHAYADRKLIRLWIQFKRAIPFAYRDVDWKDLNVISLRLLKELSRLIEAHRLTVDQSSDESCRPMSLEPARLISK